MNNSIKNYLLGTIAFLLGFSFMARAQKKIEYVLPTAEFNKLEAYKMLEEGTNTIQGNVSFKKRGYTNYPHYTDKVLLFPVTPHLLEYLELRKKYNSKRKQAALIKEAMMAKIETKTLDDKGNFEFVNLKPGKYYIVSWVAWEKVTSSQVQSGPVVANYNMLGQQMGLGYVPTETQYSSRGVEEEIGEFVEVAGDRKVIKVNMAR